MHELHVPAPKPADDDERVSVLKGLALLDTEKEICFDRITESAAKCFQVPIALVSLVDAGRQWFKSVVGLDVCETSRDYAFCAHAILPDAPNIFQVTDASQDPRFMYSDLVTGPPHIRFYAGCPLLYTDSNNREYRLGTLCVIDTKPRSLSKDEMHLLETLSRLCITEIDLRHKCRLQREEEEVTAVQNAELWAKEMNGEYIGQVAHDLRTPLNSFSMGLQALAETPLNAEQRGLLEALSVSSELMSLTCTKAIDYVRHSNNKGIQPTRGPFDLTQMLRKCLRILMCYTHGSRDVSYVFEIRNGVSPCIFSDQDWVWQMTMNYLSNARKFTTVGEIKTRAEVTHRLCQLAGEEKAMLRISVADTGIGVQDSERPALFKPFGQLQDYSGGTGLGLFSVQEKVTKLGGRCGVEDNKESNGKGSVFWFEIPYVPWEEGQAAVARQGSTESSSSHLEWVRQPNGDLVIETTQKSDTREAPSPSWPASEDEASRAGSDDVGGDAHCAELSALKPAQPDSSTPPQDMAWGTVSVNRSPETLRRRLSVPPDVPPGATSTDASKRRGTDGKKRVLVIEDDVPTRMLMVHGIKKKGFLVDQADNGEDGLEQMQGQLYSMVFCDIMMPVMDGCECVRRLRKWEASAGRLPQFVCALSANTDATDVCKYMASGMNKFYPKPVKIKELLAACEADFLEIPTSCE